MDVRHDLEHERREGRRRVVRTAHRLVHVVRVHALGVGALGRVRQVVDGGVEDLLHADVLERGAAEHREALDLDRALAERGLDLRIGDLGRIGEVLLHERVLDLGGLLDELVAVVLGLVHQVGGDLTLGDGRALVLGREVHGLHLDEVDDADEVVALADRELDRDAVGAEARADRREGEVPVGAHLVHLVDEAEAGHAVAVGLAPHGLGLRLDAFLAVKHRARAVEHAQRALDLDGEVDVAGGVDQVDLVVDVVLGPGAGRRGRLDGDAALLLLLEEVHGRHALVHLADLVVAAGVEEDAFGDGGLACVDVGADADVADLLEIGSHDLDPEFARRRAGLSVDAGRRPRRAVSIRDVNLGTNRARQRTPLNQSRGDEPRRALARRSSSELAGSSSVTGSGPDRRKTAEPNSVSPCPNQCNASGEGRSNGGGRPAGPRFRVGTRGF